jgi:hypothetical protein
MRFVDLSGWVPGGNRFRMGIHGRFVGLTTPPDDFHPYQHCLIAPGETVTVFWVVPAEFRFERLTFEGPEHCFVRSVRVGPAPVFETHEPVAAEVFNPMSDWELHPRIVAPGIELEAIVERTE